MTIVSPVPVTLQNGNVADATDVMANFNSIVADVNANAAASGANNDITSLLALSTPISYLLGGTNVWIGGAVTGTANAIVLASPVPSTGFTLTSGKRVIFFATAANTGATTLNVGATGVKNVFKLTPAGAVALTGGEIQIGVCEAVYDGTQYQLITDALTTFGPQTDLASATTTDLGTIPSHNVNVTGTTTITGFGSAASTSYPIYMIKFAGILTLTHNATSLIIPGAANITTAAGDTAAVEYLGSGNWRVRDYTRASGLPIRSVGGLKGIQAFTAGSGTYTPTAGALTGLAILTGGGGGGGGANTNDTSAGGGGGGATAFAFIAALASVSYGVGAAGAAGAIGANGGAGGQTTFGTISANGGTGGTGSTTSTPGGGGAGSSTTANATFTIAGTSGSTGSTAAPLDIQQAGSGGGSFWASGPTGVIANLDVAGLAGIVGAGGSGAVRGSANAVGGAGGAGIVVVLEF